MGMLTSFAQKTLQGGQGECAIPGGYPLPQGSELRAQGKSKYAVGRSVRHAQANPYEAHSEYRESDDQTLD